jgi:hypothetical protein
VRAPRASPQYRHQFKRLPAARAAPLRRYLRGTVLCGPRLAVDTDLVLGLEIKQNLVDLTSYRQKLTFNCLEVGLVVAIDPTID